MSLVPLPLPLSVSTLFSFCAAVTLTKKPPAMQANVFLVAKLIGHLNVFSRMSFVHVDAIKMIIHFFP